MQRFRRLAGIRRQGAISRVGIPFYVPTRHKPLKQHMIPGVPRGAAKTRRHAGLAADDVPCLEALMVEEHDLVDEHEPYVNALGIKGVGEIGITGSAGAVANAV